MTQPPPPGYEAPYGGAAPAGEHPESTKLLVLSIVGLLCCGPVAIYSFITSKNILDGPQTGYDTKKINAAKIVSLIALILWAIGIVLRAVGFATGN